MASVVFISRSARRLLLGHHGSDTLLGAGGHDVIWGDWDPVRNTTRQRDVLNGGAGNDWLYPSHGRSIVKGGPGIDYVYIRHFCAHGESRDGRCLSPTGRPVSVARRGR